MDLAELEVFLTVTAGRPLFSRAAEKMHRTQSAVSPGPFVSWKWSWANRCSTAPRARVR